MERWRIKKGDTVQVITGKDKGARGEILQVLRDERRVIVKDINVCTRHKKPSMSDPGGIVRMEKSIHASNVMLIDPTDDKPARVGIKMIDDKKTRVSRRSDTAIG